jgi:hypothetical protein
MKLNDFIEGLTILQNYYTDPNGYHIGAEHDQFFMWATDRPLTEEHATRMFVLDWFQSDSEPEKYNPEDGWSFLT